MTAALVAPAPADELEAIAESGAEERDERRVIAMYEDALTVALAETDLVRAAQAFDRADRLQGRLLRLTRTSSVKRAP